MAGTPFPRASAERRPSLCRRQCQVDRARTRSSLVRVDDARAGKVCRSPSPALVASRSMKVPAGHGRHAVDPEFG
eukprot:5273522-Prymnesium_polylepis.2